MVSFRLENGKKKFAVLFGGTGIIGGTIVNYFKAKKPGLVDIRAPSSKKVSLRECNDIREYLFTVRPDFIINAAIANINADPQLTYEVNYLGAINIARVAAALKVPYIFFSSAAALPPGNNLKETDQLPLTARLSNYAKSKIMAEQTLSYMAEHYGLDHTVIRLATVYGAHDHKIQGFHRLIFCIADRSMPFILTKKGVVHSYSSSRKLPYLIHHMLNNRQEFGGNIYHFVDREPVEFVRLILSIKSHLGVSRPKEFYIPYTIARTGRSGVKYIQRMLTSIGLKTILPAELMFLRALYRTQTLSGERLAASSFIDPLPEETVFSRLPEMIAYYLTRWSLQNLISDFDDKLTGLDASIKNNFRYNPQVLLDAIHLGAAEPLQEMSACRLDSRPIYVTD
ncbi:MAG: SDR family oxidoreductase [Deltaproteobacteria bacterium]